MVGGSALRGSDRRSNIDSTAGRLPRRRSRMAEEADSISGGARPRGSDSDSNMNSTVGRSALRGSDRHSDAHSMSAREELGPERGPELGSRIRSDKDSSLLESTDDSDPGWFVADPDAGWRRILPCRWIDKGTVTSSSSRRMLSLTSWSYES